MQRSIIEQLSELVTKAFLAQYPTLSGQPIEVTRSKDPSFGEYQCASAMKAAKHVGTNPRDVANAVVQRLAQVDGFHDLVEQVSVAGPGFINITVRPSVLCRQLEAMALSDTMVRSAEKRQKIVIDFSSPNIAKEMHVGHLRSTIIGDCLARVFEALGHDVLRLNHVGDWGTAFGMLIAHIKSQPDFSLQALSSYTLGHLMQLYRESKARFDADPTFRKQAQQEVVKLQGGDEAALAVWRTICDISEQAYQEIYSLLGVTIMERGESYYNPMLPAIVQELEQKGLISTSDGAKCLFIEGFSNREGAPLPLMLQKSDGGYNYDTTDMAAIAQRIREEHADRIVYVTDSGQSTHFQMIFKAAERAGILDPDRVRVDHVPFGLVLGPDGKKFKTRSGETERLIDLLTAAVDHAEEILRSRNPEWSDEDRRAVAKILGIGAVKYADLSSHRVSDYVFSYDRMLRFEGNTAAFIMYSYVRTSSIQRKVAGRSTQQDRVPRTLEHPGERALARVLCQFQETIDEVAESLLPNRLTDYLYGLAEEFNKFFRDCRVDGDPRQEERLALVVHTGKVLKEGLQLLGIDVPEKM